jgi:hypothetical protein
VKKRAVCGADHSPSCSAEVKNKWSYNSTNRYRHNFKAWYLIKRMNNLAFQSVPYEVKTKKVLRDTMSIRTSFCDLVLETKPFVRFS